MKKVLTVFGLLCLFALTGCNVEPKVKVDNETTDGDPAAIELTAQVEGEFIRFEGDNAVVIKYDGSENTYEIAEDAIGDFEIIEAGNKIAFSTKDVDGKEMIETLRLSE
ncbi:MAG: hypothetical protein R3250_02925 [Melioribacteraceae bacterium]|nr:hypothetical protein [Melioribacteraceae bacterium]